MRTISSDTGIDTTIQIARTVMARVSVIEALVSTLQSARLHTVFKWKIDCWYS